MTNTTTWRTIVLLSLVFLPLARSAESREAQVAYDPLAVTARQRPEPLDLTFTDAARKRELPIRVYLPAETTTAPVVLFSHGLGGSREGSAYLGKHWAARGYVAVFLQHPGSDVSVWKGKPPTEVLGSLKKALNLENLLLRVKDVPAVLDQLQRWNQQSGHALYGRLDMGRVGMSGHSFGAVTTEAVSGQAAPGGKAVFTDPRIKAAIIFSPSSPAVGSPQAAFGKVQVPWMLMTGTKDLVPQLTKTDMKSRLAVFAALPPGGKYELVLDGAEHSAFTERPLPGDTEKRNPNHHRVILALSTAFWDAWLRDDPAAKAWLDGDGPRSVMEKNDRWQRK
jgi:predicted dienelactone hydrolase